MAKSYNSRKITLLSFLGSVLSGLSLSVYISKSMWYIERLCQQKQCVFRKSYLQQKLSVNGEIIQQQKNYPLEFLGSRIIWSVIERPYQQKHVVYRASMSAKAMCIWAYMLAEAMCIQKSYLQQKLCVNGEIIQQHKNSSSHDIICKIRINSGWQNLHDHHNGLRTQDSGLRTQDSGLRTQDSGRIMTATNFIGINTTHHQ